MNDDLSIENLWRELFWLKMGFDRICPVCHEQLESGSVRTSYLEWHLEKNHPSLFKPSKEKPE